MNSEVHNICRNTQYIRLKTKINLLTKKVCFYYKEKANVTFIYLFLLFNFFLKIIFYMHIKKIYIFIDFTKFYIVLSLI